MVTGETSIAKPAFVDVVEVKSAADMFEAVSSLSAEQDIIIKAAAVADYTPTTTADNKIRLNDITLTIFIFFRVYTIQHCLYRLSSDVPLEHRE